MLLQLIVKYVSIRKYKKCRKIADYIANKLFKMKEKKINFNRKFEFIFLKKIVKKLTAFFGNFKEKETNSLQKQSFVLN